MRQRDEAVPGDDRQGSTCSTRSTRSGGSASTRSRLGAAVGLDRDGLSGLDARVPTTKVAQLFAEAERVSGDRFVGLHAAERADHRGPLIYLFMSSPRFEDGLRLGARFSRLVLDTLRITIEVEAERAATVFYPGDPTFAASHHIVEYLLLAFFRGVRRVMTRIDCSRCTSATPIPAAAAELSRAFGCPVRFAQSDDRLVYPRDELCTSVALREPADQGAAREVRDAGHARHDVAGPGRGRHARALDAGGCEPMPGRSPAGSG